MTPLANRYLRPEQLRAMEPFYPLQVHQCAACSLVQLEAFETPESIFTEYAYFSSYSQSWLEHARRYVDEVLERLALTSSHLVMEIASNDGYLLRNFVERGIPVLGIEPAANVATVAEQQGIPTMVRFFGEAMAADLVAGGYRADLLIGNNVLAHVPHLNDFVAGLSLVLAPRGTLTMEFPHLVQLIENNQFDTIYHEHLSYFSLLSVERVFAAHGLTLFDVEEIPTHGGSLRVYGRAAGDDSRPVSERVHALRSRELRDGYDTPARYASFGSRVVETKSALLDFCVKARRQGRRIAGYGAPAKGNTLLNFCGLGKDYISFTVDRSPHKQGSYLPGTHIPILPPEAIDRARPDYVLILPWNLRDEIVAQLEYVRSWGGQFVVPIPELCIL
jgi:2-polyprenyl-3-methyl-5-hydroxy-6-metoxy-1,4-benzoquinol methylase